MPDRIVQPGLTFRQRVALRALDRVLWMAVAAFLMAVAFIVLAVNLTDAVDDKRAEDTCRSRLAGEVSAAQADLSLAIGAGLEAVARDDAAALQDAFDDLDAARSRLDDAVEARERSEETCDQR